MIEACQRCFASMFTNRAPRRDGFWCLQSSSPTQSWWHMRADSIVAAEP